MSKTNYSDDFKRDAAHQITVRGYTVAEVSRCLGVSKFFSIQMAKEVRRGDCEAQSGL